MAYILNLETGRWERGRTINTSPAPSPVQLRLIRWPGHAACQGGGMAVLTPLPGYAAHIACMVVEELGAEMGRFDVSRWSCRTAEFLHQRGWPGRNRMGPAEDAAETSGYTDSRPVSRRKQPRAAPSSKIGTTAERSDLTGHSPPSDLSADLNPSSKRREEARPDVSTVAL